MKFCIIGAGGIADRRTIPAIISDKNNEIIAIMDANKEVAERIGKKYNTKYYTDEEEMLKNEDCDAVYIGTPVMCHYEQAMMALKYNKNVFLEKPICINGEDSIKLVNAFKEKDKQLSIGYMMKYHNLHVKAKELIVNGEIGDVNSIRLQFTCWYPDIVGAWRQNKKLGGGGAIMDLGVHCIELAEFILGDKIIETKAFYETKTFNYEVEDCAIIIFKTRKGILGHIDVNFNIPDKASESKLEIYGTKGYLNLKGTLAQEEVGEMAHLYSPQGDYDAAQSRVEVKPTIYQGEKGNLYLKQIQDFSKILNSGKTDYTFTDEAVHVQQIVDEIYKNA